MSMFTLGGAKASGANSNHLHEYLFNSTVLSYKTCVEELVNDIAGLMGESFDMFEPTDTKHVAPTRSTDAPAAAKDREAVDGHPACDFDSNRQQQSGKRRLLLGTQPYVSTADVATLLEAGLLPQADAQRMVRSLLMLPDVDEIPSGHPRPKKARRETTPQPTTAPSTP